jgi:hypothetical protein
MDGDYCFWWCSHRHCCRHFGHWRCNLQPCTSRDLAISPSAAKVMPCSLRYIRDWYHVGEDDMVSIYTHDPSPTLALQVGFFGFILFVLWGTRYSSFVLFAFVVVILRTFCELRKAIIFTDDLFIARPAFGNPISIPLHMIKQVEACQTVGTFGLRLYTSAGVKLGLTDSTLRIVGLDVAGKEQILDKLETIARYNRDRTR